MRLAVLFGGYQFGLGRTAVTTLLITARGVVLGRHARGRATGGGLVVALGPFILGRFVLGAGALTLAQGAVVLAVGATLGLGAVVLARAFTGAAFGLALVVLFSVRFGVLFGLRLAGVGAFLVVAAIVGATFAVAVVTAPVTATAATTVASATAVAAFALTVLVVVLAVVSAVLTTALSTAFSTTTVAAPVIAVGVAVAVAAVAASATAVITAAVVVAPGVGFAVPVLAVAALAVALAVKLLFLVFGGAEQRRQPGEETCQQARLQRRFRRAGGLLGGRLGGGFRFRFRLRLGRRRRGVRRHQLHRRLLGFDFRVLGGQGGRVLLAFQQFHLVAHLGLGLVVTDALHLEVRGFQIGVGNHQHAHFVDAFNFPQHRTLLVEQVGGHGHRHLGLDFPGALLHHLFFDQAENAQGQGFHVTDMTQAVTARAHDAGGLAEAGAQPLAGQFQQAETGDAAQLNPGAVRFQRVAHAVFHFALIARRAHVDEVDHDQAADVAQAQLAGNLFRRFQVGLQRGFLDVGALGGARGVDVDGHQRFGGVDDDGAAGGQLHFAFERGLDLRFDLVTGEQRRVVVIQLQLVLEIGHHLLHERLGLVVDLFGIDQYFADVLAQVIADRADDDVGFLVHQEGRFAGFRRLGDGAPQLEQVVEVPLQFLGAAAKAGGAHDHAHFVGDIQAAQCFLELLALLALDAAGNAAGAGVVGHQHQVTAGQADKGGEGGAFVTALLFVHLNDDFLTFLDHILDIDAALDVLGVFLEVLAGNFLEGQKTVTLGAEVHEGGFQGRLNARDLAFIDVGFFLFAGAMLDVQIIKSLAIHQRHPDFFRMAGVD